MNYSLLQELLGLFGLHLYHVKLIGNVVDLLLELLIFYVYIGNIFEDVLGELSLLGEFEELLLDN